MPNVRVQMDAVPGRISSLWFTPSKTGTDKIACAEYCGVGHFGMRGVVGIDDETALQAWLEKQPTFAQAISNTQLAASAQGDGLAGQGRKLAQAQGCLGCHSVDRSPGAGPSWKGLYGKTEVLTEGPTVTAAEA